MNFKFYLSFFFLLAASLIFGQDLSLVKKKNGKFGYINTTGEMVIPFQFRNAKSFSDGLAAATKDKKWGYINSSGEWVITPKYKSAKPFDSGVASVKTNNGWSYIDTKGQFMEMPSMEKFYDFNEGVAFYRKGEKVGLIGTDGKIILEPEYDVIRKFRNGHAKVKKGELWGMINTKGKVVIPIDFEEIGNTYSSKGVFVKKGNIYGIYANGDFNPIAGATKVWNFSEGSIFTYARKEEKMGFVNSKGEWVIPPTFEQVRPFYNGLAPVLKDKKWGYINEKGEVVIDYQYNNAETFRANGLAPVKGKHWGFIDKTGKLIIPMDYDISHSFRFNSDLSRPADSFRYLKGGSEKGFINETTMVKTRRGWGFLNEKGEVLGDSWFEMVQPFVKIN